jgi:hypothetical protein
MGAFLSAGIGTRLFGSRVSGIDATVARSSLQICCINSHPPNPARNP